MEKQASYRADRRTLTVVGATHQVNALVLERRAGARPLRHNPLQVLTRAPAKCAAEQAIGTRPWHHHRWTLYQAAYCNARAVRTTSARAGKRPRTLTSSWPETASEVTFSDVPNAMLAGVAGLPVGLKSRPLKRSPRYCHVQTVEPPSTYGAEMLHEFLSANQAELIRRCRSKVGGRSSPRVTPLELEHGVPRFLEQLVDALRLAESTRTAIADGDELFEQGYTVGQSCMVTATFAKSSLNWRSK